MNRQQFWQLIETARSQVSGPEEAGDVARRVASQLASYPAEEIVAADQVLWNLMAHSYTNPLWAAAYVINGGCSDDGFDYFRGWLIAQGRETFEHVVGDPDALAGLPVVRASAASGGFLECEEVLSMGWNAHIVATGRQLPDGTRAIRYPEPGPAWNFDFDDDGEIQRRLPRLAALYLK